MLIILRGHAMNVDAKSSYKFIIEKKDDISHRNRMGKSILREDSTEIICKSVK